MTELDDQELLAEFARSASESAFDTLVARHVNLVYSTALRFTGNPHHAQEITQAVFVILARKAGSLRRGTVLSGWLYQTARLTAANFVKGETRRQRREQEAYMLSTLNESGPAAWQQIAALLDDAMGDLGETDRNAVVLRFFENKTAQEVGAALNLTEAAAHKRVSRALEKLRLYLSKRGIALPAAALTAAISANAVQAAPVGLAITISTAAALTGTTLATATTATAIKTIAMTTMQKTVITATLAIVAGVGIYEAARNSQLSNQVQNLQQQQAPLAEQLRELQKEYNDATNQLAALRDDNERLNRNTGDLLRLRGEVGLFRRELAAKTVPPEPTYEGKTLRYWISSMSYLPRASDRERAAHQRTALLAMGEPAIRYLHWLIAHPKSLDFTGVSNYVDPENHPPNYSEVIIAIKSIGSGASAIAPDLVRLWESNKGDRSFSTYNGFPLALAELGNSSPEVIAALHRHFDSRYQVHGALSALAAWRLNESDADAADIVRRSLTSGDGDTPYVLMEILAETGTKVTPFISEIQQLIDKSVSARPDQQAKATMATWRLFQQPDQAVELVQRLGAVASKANATANEVNQFAAAARDLMEISASRQPSITILKELTRHPDKSASKFCSQVLSMLERVEGVR